MVPPKPKQVLIAFFLLVIAVVTAWAFWKNSIPHSPAGAGLPRGHKSASHLAPAPDATFTVQGKQRSLGGYIGHRKLVVWLYSTWCPICADSLRALARKKAEFARDGITIIILKNYKDDYYPGPPAATFVKRFAPSVWGAPRWVFGTATREMAKVYNPNGDADIFYLIDARGMVRGVGSGPDGAMPTILKFARSRLGSGQKASSGGN